MFRFLCNHINLFSAKQVFFDVFSKGIIKIVWAEKPVSSGLARSPQETRDRAASLFLYQTARREVSCSTAETQNLCYFTALAAGERAFYFQSDWWLLDRGCRGSGFPAGLPPGGWQEPPTAPALMPLDCCRRPLTAPAPPPSADGHWPAAQRCSALGHIAGVPHRRTPHRRTLAGISHKYA